MQLTTAACNNVVGLQQQKKLWKTLQQEQHEEQQQQQITTTINLGQFLCERCPAAPGSNSDGGGGSGVFSHKN